MLRKLMCFLGMHRWGEVRLDGTRRLLGQGWEYWSQCKHCKAFTLFRN